MLLFHIWYAREDPVFGERMLSPTGRAPQQGSHCLLSEFKLGAWQGEGEAIFWSPIPKTSQSRKPVFTNAYVRKAGGKSAGHRKS